MTHMNGAAIALIGTIAWLVAVASGESIFVAKLLATANLGAQCSRVSDKNKTPSGELCHRHKIFNKFVVSWTPID